MIPKKPGKALNSTWTDRILQGYQAFIHPGLLPHWQTVASGLSGQYLIVDVTFPDFSGPSGISQEPRNNISESTWALKDHSLAAKSFFT